MISATLHQRKIWIFSFQFPLLPRGGLIGYMKIYRVRQKLDKLLEISNRLLKKMCLNYNVSLL